MTGAVSTVHHAIVAGSNVGGRARVADRSQHTPADGKATRPA
jgi:hypothetical protein